MYLSRYKSLFRLSAIRQALVLLSLFSVISIVAGGGTYWLVQSEMLRAVDARLNARMDIAVAALAAGDGLPLPEDGESARLITNTDRLGFWTDP